MNKIPFELIAAICDCMNNGSLFSMALSSRSLMEPALDSLWKEVRAFEPLICCLPDDLLSHGGDEGGVSVYNLKREVVAQDLDRYLKVYAPRIRFLVRDDYPSARPPLSAQALQGLHLVTACVPGALSPNLVTLDWPLTRFGRLDTASTAELAATHISLFAGNDLVSLHLTDLRSCLDWGAPSSPAVHSAPPLYRMALFLTAQRLKGLRRLKLDFEAVSSPNLSEELMMRCSWDSLEYLEIGKVSWIAFDRISRLPRLKELRLLHPTGTPQGHDVAQPIAYPHRTFPSLEVLVLRTGEGFPWATSILQHLPLDNQLQALGLYVYGQESFAEAESLFATIKQRCNTSTLTTLLLDLEDRSAGPSQEGIEVDLDQELDISPLLAFTKLRHFEVHSHHHLRIGTAENAALSLLSGLQKLKLQGGALAASRRL